MAMYILQASLRSGGWVRVAKKKKNTTNILEDIFCQNEPQSNIFVLGQNNIKFAVC